MKTEKPPTVTSLLKRHFLGGDSLALHAGVYSGARFSSLPTNSGKGMLFLVEQAFVGSDEKRAPLKMPAWQARDGRNRSHPVLLIPFLTADI